jgi:hypothetical protein
VAHDVQQYAKNPLVCCNLPADDMAGQALTMRDYYDNLANQWTQVCSEGIFSGYVHVTHVIMNLLLLVVLIVVRLPHDMDCQHHVRSADARPSHRRCKLHLLSSQNAPTRTQTVVG